MKSASKPFSTHSNKSKTISRFQKPLTNKVALMVKIRPTLMEELAEAVIHLSLMQTGEIIDQKNEHKWIESEDWKDKLFLL